GRLPADRPGRPAVHGRDPGPLRRTGAPRPDLLGRRRHLDTRRQGPRAGRPHPGFAPPPVRRRRSPGAGGRTGRTDRRDHRLPRMTAAVLVDLDGTLLDHEGAAAEAITWSFPDAEPAWLAPRWSRLGEESIPRYLAGELSFTAQRRVRITTLTRELGLGDWDDARADAWFVGFLAAYERAWRPFPEVKRVLEKLSERGLPLGVITNGDAAQQRRKIERTGLAG